MSSPHPTNSPTLGPAGSAANPACCESTVVVSLAKLAAGQTGHVCETCLDPFDAAMLRAMGMRPNATIRICRLGEPCIVQVMAGPRDEACLHPAGLCTRIGLARELAERVMVRVSMGAPASRTP